MTRLLVPIAFLSRDFPFFFFNDTATTEIYTLSLHDALPIWMASSRTVMACASRSRSPADSLRIAPCEHSEPYSRSEEHTSELQSQFHLVCRLLLEKKKQKEISPHKLNQKLHDT